MHWHPPGSRGPPRANLHSLVACSRASAPEMHRISAGIDCSVPAVLTAQNGKYGAVDDAYSLPSPAAEVFPSATLLRARRSKMPLMSACLVVPAVTPSARSFW